MSDSNGSAILKAVMAVQDKLDTSVNHIHGRLAELVEAQSEMKVDVAVIKTEMNHIPKQPCDTVLGVSKKIDMHVGEHEEIRKAVRMRFIFGLIGMGFAVATAGVIAWIKLGG